MKFFSCDLRPAPSRSCVPLRLSGESPGCSSPRTVSGHASLDRLLTQANEGTLSKLCCEGRLGDKHLPATPGAVTTF